MASPLESDVSERLLDKFSDRMRLSSSEHIVDRFLLLQREPHRLNILWRVPPVPTCIEVAKKQLLLPSSDDPRYRARDLSRYERLTPSRRLMIEHDPIARG